MRDRSPFQSRPTRSPFDLQTEHFLAAFDTFPALEYLAFQAPSFNINPKLFADERIRRLHGFHLSNLDGLSSSSDQVIPFDDKLLTSYSWLTLTLTVPTKVTVDGLNEVIRQWTIGEREIEDYCIDVLLKQGENIRLDGLVVSKVHGLERTLSRTMDENTLTLTAFFLGLNLHVSIWRPRSRR